MKDWTGEDVTRIAGVLFVGTCAILCVVKGDVMNAFAFCAIAAPGFVHSRPAVPGTPPAPPPGAP